MRYTAVFTLALILAACAVAQDCPPAGCNCYWYGDVFDDNQSTTTWQTLQHNGAGNHSQTGMAKDACTFTPGAYNPSYQLYHCLGTVSTSFSSHTFGESGAVYNTYVGNLPAVHYVKTREAGCTLGPSYGDINIPALMVATAGECATTDHSCYTDGINILPIGSCPSASATTYTPQLGATGSSLWHGTYTFPFTCPDTWAEAPSPIVIPLHGGGYEDAFTDFDAGDTVTFHLIEDPKSAYPMSWIAKDAPFGFLALDRNFNGMIDNFRELFGNLTPQPLAPTILPNGQRDYPKYEKLPGHPGYTPNGFAALAYFDRIDKGGNGNGVFDPGDSAWTQVKVWEDTCHCGISSEGKMHSLDELGITEIGLKFVEENRRDRYGNGLRFKGYMIQHGAHVSIYDVFFRTK